jgi:hypothetical protein
LPLGGAPDLITWLLLDADNGCTITNGSGNNDESAFAFSFRFSAALWMRASILTN